MKLLLISLLAANAQATEPAQAPASRRPAIEMPTAAKPKPFSLVPPKGCNGQELLDWLQRYRDYRREQYAQTVALSMPKMSGAQCIKSKKNEGVSAEYVADGDYFKISCLAEKNGRLSHVFEAEIEAGVDSCLTDDRFVAWINGNFCTQPGGAQTFVNMELARCKAGPIPVRFKTQPKATPVDIEFLNAEIARGRTEVSNILDSNGFLIKSAPKLNSDLVAPKGAIPAAPGFGSDSAE